MRGCAHGRSAEQGDPVAGSTTAPRQAEWYARSNPWVAAAVDSLVGNVVGAGIKPQSSHPDHSGRERPQVLGLRWTDLAASRSCRASTIAASARRPRP